MHPILQIEKLQIKFTHEGGFTTAVRNSNFIIPHGKLVAIVGESGSGKSITALSILQLLPEEAHLNGNIIFSEDGKKKVNLSTLDPKQIRNIRGNKIAMIFQEPMTSLNPVYTCGYQVMEAMIQHQRIGKNTARKKTVELFEKVHLPDPTGMLKRYPHQISGGQKQRVMIAMAMSCKPSLLIADEPTTALDVSVQKNILGLIKKLQQQDNMAVMLITHDLGLVSDVADEIVVMYQGEIVEQGSASQVLEKPQHPYTKALLACRPSASKKNRRLAVINDYLEGNEMNKIIETSPTSMQNNPTGKKIILSVRNLEVTFPVKKNIFGKTLSEFKAVNNVSFDVYKNDIIGLVGESGCGKTTLGRAILQLVKPSAGQILLEGKDIASTRNKQMREVRKNLQIVFQDPYGSLNPRITIGDAILEPMAVHHMYNNTNQRRDKVFELLKKVDLMPEHFNRFPHQFSGGQRQRICIARALALNPSFLIFDESVSALDVSVQAQVLNIINDLKNEFEFTSIFISHNLSVVHYISNWIMVMRNGVIIEEGRADEIYFNPQNEYTKQLLAAIPGKKIAI